MDVDETRSCLKLAMCYQSRVKQNYLNMMHSKPTFSVKPQQKASPVFFFFFPFCSPKPHMFTCYVLIKLIKRENLLMSKET